MSDHIPPEVILEILLRLPSKSLIRFTCVCKSWHSLILSSDFSSMYADLHNSAINTNFIIRHYSRVSGKEVFSLHSDHNDASFRSSKLLDFPLIRNNRGYHNLVGSCNGLICSSDSDLGVDPKTLVIWNPSLGVFRVLPPRNSRAWFKCSVLTGFGFDFKSSDYKVVKIYKEKITGNLKNVELFSLNEDRWRNCRGEIAIRNFKVTKPSQVFVNGNTHWLGCGTDDRKWFIIVFDLCKEVFGELGLPIELPNDEFNKPDRSIVKFGGSLSLMRYGENDGTSFNRCCVWVMKEYGVSESWMRLYTICPFNVFWKTLELRRNGEVLLATNNGELVSYDLNSGGFNGLKLYGEGESFYVDNYVESLVLLDTRAVIKRDWKKFSRC